MAADFSQASAQAMNAKSISEVDAASGEAPALEVSSSADAQRFAQSMSAARENFSQANQSEAPVRRVGESKSIGNQMMSGLSDMSGRLQADHKHISGMIEKATVSGDPNVMIKAMTLLADYQTRVQIVSKVVSKAATSLDSLTRLQ
jgi:hypothetical protein